MTLHIFDQRWNFARMCDLRRVAFVNSLGLDLRHPRHHKRDAKDFTPGCDGIIIPVVVAERYTRGGIRACMEIGYERK